MKESIANSYLFMIIMVILALISIIVVSSLSYSKTYKIKNRIVQIIEKHNGFDNDTQKDIEAFLKTAGYPVATANTKCPKGRGVDTGLDGVDSGIKAINSTSNYKYCIYKYQTAKGSYYSVVTYMSFQLPLIGNLLRLEFPLYGDTKIIMNF